jgi:hypothetical protein
MADNLTRTDGPCERCKQPRPLFRYEPTHNGHLGGYGADCTWCTRTQPLLCARCWSAEREREEADPRLTAEGEFWEALCAANSNSVSKETTNA